MILLGYIRVSSAMQLDGDGPERQQLAIEQFCAQHGAKLARVFIEPVTGKADSLSRPVFAELLELATRSKVGGIVVERMDRLARDLMISEALLHQCFKLGVKVFSADQGVMVDMSGSDNGDPTRKFIRQVLGAVAELEKSMLVMKLSSAKSRIRKKTGRCEGAKPYGFYPREAPVLRLIKSFHANGQSLSGIAGLLNSSGFKTRFGKEWTKDNVFNVVTALVPACRAALVQNKI